MPAWSGLARSAVKFSADVAFHFIVAAVIQFALFSQNLAAQTVDLRRNDFGIAAVKLFQRFVFRFQRPDINSRNFCRSGPQFTANQRDKILQSLNVNLLMHLFMTQNQIIAAGSGLQFFGKVNYRTGKTDINIQADRNDTALV